MPNGEWINCWKCKTEYFLPRELYVAAKANAKISFNCPYGHSAHFPEGETEAEKMRRERDMLKQRLARKDDDVLFERRLREQAERSTSAYKGQVTKLKNRSKAGVCPCCNRTFKQLAAHMANKHPNFDPAEPLTIIDGGKAS